MADGEICQRTKVTADGRTFYCGQVHNPAKCTGHTSVREDPDDRRSRIVGIRPCRQNPVRGLKVCVTHGGASKRAKAKAAERVAEEKAMNAKKPGRPPDPEVALRRAEALKMRLAGAGFAEIARQLGYASPESASKDVRRALALTIAEPAEELRAIEVQRLDQQLQRIADAEAKVHEVLAREHLTVSNGRVVTLDGVPIKDDTPILQAVGQLKGLEELRLRIADRRAKLCGLDAPKQVEVITVDAIDAEIRRLEAELAEQERTAKLDGGDTGETPAAEGAARTEG